MKYVFYFILIIFITSAINYRIEQIFSESIYPTIFGGLLALYLYEKSRIEKLTQQNFGSAY